MSTVPQPPAHLLQHVGWLRELARSLVADPARADDLAQETWLLVLKRAPAALRSPRAWLAAVLRSLWLQDLRRGAARRAADEVAARDEAAKGCLDVVERASTHRLLVELVTELEEPFRTALLMGYFDELTPRQIAERLGVPLPTVRSRIRRGLERLRDRLDARSGGDRRAWLSSVAPLAIRGGERAAALLPAAQASTSASALGWIVMQTRMKLLIAGVVLVGGSAWVLPGIFRAGRVEPAEEGSRNLAPAATEEARANAAATSPAELARVSVESGRGAMPAGGEGRSDMQGSDALLERLERVAASYLTEQPQIHDLAELVGELADDAQVVTESVEKTPFGAVTGELTACDGRLIGRFEQDGEHYGIEFDTRPGEGLASTFALRSLTIVLRDAAGTADDAGAGFQHHPRTNEDPRAHLASDQEILVGWGVAFGADGAKAHPTTMRLEPSEKSWVIGRTDSVPALEEPGYWNPSPWDVWLRKLRPYGAQ